MTKLRLAAAGLTVAMTTAAVVVPLTAVSADAQARTCAVDTVVYKTPKKGRVVWIPTNQYGAWQVGGTQGRSYSQGEATARSKGSSDTVGGSAGGDIKLVSVSAKYDHTWNRSTTRTVSWTKGYSFTLNLPDGKRSRTRLYHKGFKFPVKQIITYTNNCETKIFWHSAVLPTKRNTAAHYLWAVELYKNRGKLK
jgi:hypothetical protein